MAFLLAAACAFSLAVPTSALDLSKNSNLNVYWGQNSVGSSSGASTSDYQKPLGDYCDDDTYDTLLLSFLTVVNGTGGYPEINFSNTCADVTNGTFPGTDLANCTAMAADLNKCQSAGKAVLLSIGGATGGVSFTDNASASTFADEVWNLFLGGTSDIRPLGDAVLDGIDLDIEGGTTSDTLSAFVAQLRTHFIGADKTYYLSSAPQCPFPDAYVGTVLNEQPFDFVNVQFYNNYCGLTGYNNSNAWDYSSWDNWAKTTSPNPDAKIFIGAPASATAATSGYVDAVTLGGILQATQANTTTLGGAMLWDASQAAANDNFGAKVKAYLTGSSQSDVRPKALSNLRDTTVISKRWRERLRQVKIMPDRI